MSLPSLAIAHPTHVLLHGTNASSRGSEVTSPMVQRTKCKQSSSSSAKHVAFVVAYCFSRAEAPYKSTWS